MSAQSGLFANPRRVTTLADLLANVSQLGYEWERIKTILGHSNLKVDYTVLIPNRVRAGYVDTSAELGHWLEICQLQREDIDFFTALIDDSA